jgi:hypothetical protein
MTKHEREFLASLRAYVETDAICPCCEESRQCLEECTFKQDVGRTDSYYQRMLRAREVLAKEAKP